MRWIGAWRTVGKHLSEIPEPSGGRREIRAIGFNRTKAAGGRPGRVLAKNHMAHYQNACLETDADELVDIRFKVTSYPSVFKQVAMAINDSDPIAGGSMAICQLRGYRVTDSTPTTKSFLGALKSSPRFKHLEGAALRMGFGSGLDISRTPTKSSFFLEGRDEIVAKYSAKGDDKERKIPETPLLGFRPAFAKLQKVAGLSAWGTPDLNFLNIEAAHRPNSYQPRKLQEENPSFCDRKAGMSRHGREFETPEKISAWASRLAAGACLRWNGFFNSALSTLVLMNECRICFAAKTKTRRKPDGSPLGGSSFLSLAEIRIDYERGMDFLRRSQEIKIGISGSAKRGV